mmetsp:Transcript_4947/g.13310  ORF Transcript_4947/g.13310 Transcript_4947/m.13310 type:complete len:542 (-) Transcript_4947:989-2614(-)
MAPGDAGAVQVVDATGKVADSATWFRDDAEIGAEAYRVIGVLGAQGSGKSTLLNELFGTQFSVGSARAALGKATTKGIVAAKSNSEDSRTVALDVEGADARDRGSDGQAFAAKCAAFVATLCDALLVNIWYRELARMEGAAGFALLNAVFEQTVQMVGIDSASKTLLVFVVRDTEDCSTESFTSVASRIRDGCESRWAALKQDTTFDDLFELRVSLLSHPRHQKDQFQKGCKDLVAMLDKEIVTDMSKGISADEVGTSAKQNWESVSVPQKSSGEVSRSHRDEAAALRADRVFSQSLDTLAREAGKMEHQLDAGQIIESFGSRAEEIFNAAVDQVQAELSDCQDDPLVDSKTQQLRAAHETVLHGIFIKQLHVLRENALSHFKAQLNASEYPDLAFYTADTLFLREAQKSVRPGSSWTFENEHADLQALMTELLAQRKRLQAFRADAVQANQTAMQVLQMQQAQMNAIQQQAMGGVSGQWNTQAMYRPPDTNFNVTLGYQPGRTTVNVGMVPEESSAMLGGSGFTAGIGPMNLGLNLNINI